MNIFNYLDIETDVLRSLQINSDGDPIFLLREINDTYSKLSKALSPRGLKSSQHEFENVSNNGGILKDLMTLKNKIKI